MAQLLPSIRINSACKQEKSNLEKGCQEGNPFSDCESYFLRKYKKGKVPFIFPKKSGYLFTGDVYQQNRRFMEQCPYGVLKLA